MAHTLDATESGVKLSGITGDLNVGDVLEINYRVLADAFYAKGEDCAETLLSSVAALIQTSATRASSHQNDSAPVWIPRNGKDSNGIPYIVITCTECLPSFPLNVSAEASPEVLETQCLFCSNPVRYIIDFSFGVLTYQGEDNPSSPETPRRRSP